MSLLLLRLFDIDVSTMDLTSDEKRRIKRRMREPLVTGLGLSTL
jgi:hypothetical protein